jgi:hypothetical protein
MFLAYKFSTHSGFWEKTVIEPAKRAGISKPGNFLRNSGFIGQK